MLTRARRRRTRAAAPRGGRLAILAGPFAGIAGAAAAVWIVGVPAAAQPAGAGGTYGSPPPHVRSIVCQARCETREIARPGSRLRISGRNLRSARTVVFLGTRAEGDEVRTRPRGRRSRHRLRVRVPAHARSGPIRVVAAGGTPSQESRQVVVVDQPPAPPTPGSGRLLAARMNVRHAFYAAERRATITYVVGGSRPAYVQVELVRARDGASVRKWPVALVEPGEPQSVSWDGTAGGHVQRTGAYVFRVYALAGGDGAVPPAASAAGAHAAQASDAFLFLRDEFPVRGPHRIDRGAGRFGSGRAGHTHQGQDVFAKCGTPIAAARGGTVEHKDRDGAAGNYVVIHNAGGGSDYVYMHLRRPAVVDEGDHVFTGEHIGDVGDTGDAVGCHLHFEMWSAPGWYKGGKPHDPFSALRSWDRVS